MSLSLAVGDIAGKKEARTCRAAVAPLPRTAPPRPDGRASLSPDPASPAARDPRGCSSPFPRRASLRRRLRPRDNAATLLRGARAAAFALAALAALALGLPEQAAAQEITLVSNVGQNNVDLNGAIHPIGPRAQQFETGSSPGGYTLTKIVVNIRVGGGTPTFVLYGSTDTDLPDYNDKIVDLSGSTFNAGQQNFTPDSPTVLSASTKYFILFVSHLGTINLQRTGSEDIDSGASPGWDIADTSLHSDNFGSSWTSSFAVEIAVKGTIIPNAAPTAADNTVTTGVGTAYAFTADDFGFADTNAGATLASVKILTVPAAGNLALAGTAVMADAVVTKAQIDDGDLIFTPMAGASGDPYTAFTFKVNDGMVDSDRAYTMYIDVKGVDDPVVTAPNVFRVPAVLTADTSPIMDSDGVAMASYSYQWLRVNSDSVSNETMVGANSSTYTLTAADAGRKIKVRVSFTDDGGNAEQRTSAAYPAGGDTILGEAVCAAPALTGGATRVWTGTIQVGASTSGRGYHGFNNGAINQISTIGELDTTDFDIGGTTYTVTAAVANPFAGGARVVFALDTTLPAGERDKLTLYYCDQPYAFGDATIATTFVGYTWESPVLDWSTYATRTLSLHRDAAAPTLVQSAVNGTSLVLTFSENLDTGSAPPTSAFTVTATPSGGSAATAGLASGSSAAISGSTVTLTLASAVAAGTGVTVAYTKPTTGSNNKLRDAAKNEVANFSGQTVVNATGDTTAPTFGTAVLGEDGVTLTVTFSEALDVNSVPAAADFTVQAGGSAVALAEQDAVSVSGDTLVLKLASGVPRSVVVTLSYVKPSANPIQDLAGNDAASSANRAVINQSVLVAVSIEAVHPSAMPLVAEAEFKVVRSQALDTPLTVHIEIDQSENYLSSTMRTMTIAANETEETATFPVSNAALPPGALTATVVAGDGYVPAGAPNDSASVRMVIPDPLYSVQWAQYAVSTTEGVDIEIELEVTVRIPDGAPAPRRDVQIGNVITSKVTATPGLDYTEFSRALPDLGPSDFSPQGTGYVGTTTITVDILDDTEYEVSEQFGVALVAGLGMPPTVDFRDCAEEHKDANGNCFVAVTIEPDDDAVGVASVEIVSTPKVTSAGATSADTYGASEPITIGVNTNGPVTVVGRPSQLPYFEFMVGSGTPRRARFQGIDNSDMRLLFSYTVQSTDTDTDGISWAANALALNGGAIKFKSDVPAERVDAQLTHDAMDADAAHKVDGSMGSNNAATGTVTVTGTANVGGTLTATVSGVVDSDGLANVSYSYQWLRVASGTATEIADAVSDTYTPVGADVDKTLKVQVRFTDDLGYVEELESAATATVTGQADTDEPVLSDATVDGTSLVLVYEEDLDTGSVPVAGDFAVTVAGQPATVSNVGVLGRAVTLTLANAVVFGQTVTVSYTVGTNPIQDLGGNNAVALSSEAVDNNTISAPGAPRNLGATASDGRVTLTWTAPASTGGAAISKYQYRARQTGTTPWTPNWMDVPDGSDPGGSAADESRVMVSGLTNGTEYRFEVRAVNRIGGGTVASRNETPVATPARVPGRPRSLLAASGDGQVTLTWEAPQNDGGADIVRYDYRHAQGTSVPASEPWLSAGLNLRQTVAGLDNGGQYTFEVRAANSAGESDPASIQARPAANANAPSAPRFVKAIASDRHVGLTWFAPARDGGSSISKYQYRHASGTSVPDDTPWRSGTSYRLQAGFGSLINGQRYTFQVRAVGAEEGPAASVAATPSANPVRRPPGAVSGLAATAEAYADDHRRRQYGRVSLSWSPSAGDDNSVLERFEYRYAQSGSALPARWLHGPSDRLSETVKRLKLKTVYVFEVRAVNLEGPGPAVRRLIRTPEPPETGISLFAPGSTAIEGEALTIEARRASDDDDENPATFVMVGVTDSAFPDIPALGGPLGGTGAGGHVVQFQPGATSATDTITVEFDGAQPASRSLTITLQSVQSPYYYGTPETLVIEVSDRDAALRVRDARVREGPGAMLAFAVTLDRPRDREVRVNYATSDGTATEGDDYTRTAGTLVFSARETFKTVSVPVLDDAHDEGSETLTLTLSNARGAAIDDATAVGTIVNSDPLPNAWLSRFGRAASDHVVQSIGRRLEGGARESHLTVMGWRADSLFEPSHSERDAREPRPDAPGRQPEGSVLAPDGRIGAPRAMTGATRGFGAMSGPGAAAPAFDGAMAQGFPPMQGGKLQSPAHAMGGLPANASGSPANAGGNPASASAMGASDNRWLNLMGRLFMSLGPNGGEALAMPGLRDMVMGSSFYYGYSPDAGPLRGMNRLTAWGESASTRFSGAEGKLSLDGEVNTAIVGADGEWGRWLAGLALSYSEGEGGYRQASAKGGAVSSTLSGINPYARYRLDERTSLWATLGYGSGRLTLTPDGAESVLETDMTNAMAAFGGRGVLSMRAGETGQFELALRSDAMLTDTASMAVVGLSAGEGATSRIRLILEGTGSLPAFGGVLAPKVEAGLRYDGGDAETGAGLEVGGGLAYDKARLTVQVDGRVLLTHRDRDYEEWGYSLSFVYKPGEDGRGLRYRAGSQWGATQSGVQSLWSLQNAGGLANAARTADGQRYTAELGYGFGVRRLWYPYVATESGGASSQSLRFGLKLNAASDLEAGLEIGRRSHLSGQMENDIRLQWQARW